MCLELQPSQASDHVSHPSCTLSCTLSCTCCVLHLSTIPPTGPLPCTATTGVPPTWCARRPAAQAMHTAGWRQPCTASSAAAPWRAPPSAAQPATCAPRSWTTTLPTRTVSTGVDRHVGYNNRCAGMCWGSHGAWLFVLLLFLIPPAHTGHALLKSFPVLCSCFCVAVC